ncbi:MAG: ABC transporter substrate-binding protein [Aestuariivirga sp.]|uniref:ABC transporter substrate-binding protein n=1 Tax=Aestuariivirga sp. TaxID=2650926 RepID=UPI00301887BA
MTLRKSFASFGGWRRHALFASAFILTAFSLAAVSPEAQAEGIKRGGTLIMARPDEPLTFDPFIAGDNGSIYAIEQVCDALVEADDSGRGLRPGIAESWEMSPDGLTYTFKIRDAKFSNGDPVTVDDVVFTLKTLSDPSKFLAFVLKPVKNITVVDDKHVKVELKEPYAPLLAALSAYAASIVNKKAYEASPEKFGTSPVCAGPFMVESYERGSAVVLKANPYYWDKGADGKPLPYLDGVELKYVPESNSRVLGLRNGDYDMISTVAFNQAKALQSDSNLVVESTPIFRLDYVYLNHQKKPLDNKDFRLALNYAADREAILKAVYFGYGEVPNSYMPKVNFHSDSVPVIPFDLAKAKELVQTSGYDGTPIQIMVDTGNAPSRQVATILQQGWEAAGIKSEIVEMDVGTAWTMTTKGDYQAYVSYITSDINDTDELATIQADVTAGSQAFFTWYDNKDVQKMLTEARREPDPAKRAALYAKVQEIVYNDAYSIPLNFAPVINGSQAYVKDLKQLANGWWWLQKVWLDK